MQKQAAFSIGEKIMYYRRGACFRATVREDLGVLRGAGRRYRITPRDGERALDYFVFDVAERFLVRAED